MAIKNPKMVKFGEFVNWKSLLWEAWKGKLRIGELKRRWHFSTNGNVPSKRAFSNDEDNLWLCFWLQNAWTARLSEHCVDPQLWCLILSRCNDFFHEKTQSFQDDRSKLGETENEMETAIDSRFFAASLGLWKEEDLKLIQAILTASTPFVPNLSLRNFCLFKRLSTRFLPRQSFRRSTTNPTGAFAMLKRKISNLRAMLVYCSRKLAISAGCHGNVWGLPRMTISL
jgi:hypothetical protein